MKILTLPKTTFEWEILKGRFGDEKDFGKMCTLDKFYRVSYDIFIRKIQGMDVINQVKG